MSAIFQHLKAEVKGRAAKPEGPDGKPPPVPKSHAQRMLDEAAAFRASRAAEEEMADDDAPGGAGASPSAAAAPEEGEVRMPARSRWLDADSDEEEEGGGASAAAAPAQRAGSGEAQPPPPPAQAGGASPQAQGAEQPGYGGGTPEAAGAASAPPSRPASERVRLDDDDDDRGSAATSPSRGPTPGRASTPGRAPDAGPAQLQADGARRVFSTVSFSGKPMPPGLACRSVDVYEKLHKIDEGTYGVVYKAKERKTGDIVALKQVKLLTVKEARARIDRPCNPAPRPDTPDPDASPDSRAANRPANRPDTSPATRPDLSDDLSPVQGFPVTALREINVLLSLSHPNIINVRERVRVRVRP